MFICIYMALSNQWCQIQCLTSIKPRHYTGFRIVLIMFIKKNNNNKVHKMRVLCKISHGINRV